MEKQMYDSLSSIKAKHAEYKELLQSQEVLSDIKRYTTISKEFNSIDDVVKKFDEFLLFEKQEKDAKTIIGNEKDDDLIQMAKLELDEARTRQSLLEEEIKVLLIPQDPNDDKNVIVEIRGAAGGDEANIFASDLFDIYSKFFSNHDMKVSLIDSSRGESGGYSLLVFKVSGDKVYSQLKFESGVHRVQRVPVTETQGRVHTSTVTVTVLPEADESVEIEINPADLKIETFRSGGAGGQHVNTTDSAVRITHMPTGIVVKSQDGRSQLANRETAMNHLKTKLYELDLAKKEEESAVFRKLAGTGARAEKIRTYNYPQDRVTDHRISFSCSLKSIVGGNLKILIDELLSAEKAEKIKEANL